jgi:hypothetical protein
MVSLQALAARVPSQWSGRIAAVDAKPTLGDPRNSLLGRLKRGLQAARDYKRPHPNAALCTNLLRLGVDARLTESQLEGLGRNGLIKVSSSPLSGQVP